ncbi:MAG TPA: hypothetical protein VIS31_13350 [Woeseiaceae bacterium]
MATPETKPARFQLPTRIRSKKEPRVTPSLTFADRVASLPGIEIKAPAADGAPAEISIYLNSGDQPTLLCSLLSTGIAVHGLDNWDRHQVVSRGWGRLVQNRVMLFLPRDDGELDVCWDILKRATTRLAQPSAVPARHSLSVWDMPSYSRTTLQ